LLDSNQDSTPDTSETSPSQQQYFARPDHPSDDEEDYNAHPEEGHTPPKGGYDSRVQQILYENPELDIVITEAGKSSDGGYIVYKIRTGVRHHATTGIVAANSFRTLKSPGDIQNSVPCGTLW
jgi:hypothetical protein